MTEPHHTEAPTEIDLESVWWETGAWVAGGIGGVAAGILGWLIAVPIAMALTSGAALGELASLLSAVVVVPSTLLGVVAGMLIRGRQHVRLEVRRGGLTVHEDGVERVFGSGRLSAHVVGRHLVIRSPGSRTRVYLPGGPNQRRRVGRALAAHGLDAVVAATEEEGGLLAAHTSASTDAMRVVLDPVFARTPMWMLMLLSAAVATAAGMVAGFAAFAVVDGAGLAVHPQVLGTWVGVLSVLAGIMTMGVTLLREPRRLVLELRAARLHVEVEGRFRSRGHRFDLADVSDVRAEGPALVVEGIEGTTRFRLPGRSTATVQALDAMLDRFHERARPRLGDRDDVPGAIHALRAPTEHES